MYTKGTKLIRTRCDNPMYTFVQLHDIVIYQGKNYDSFCYVTVVKSTEPTIINNTYIVDLYDFAPLQPVKRIHHDTWYIKN